jgi:hypothetical protein
VSRKTTRTWSLHGLTFSFFVFFFLIGFRSTPLLLFVPPLVLAHIRLLEGIIASPLRYQGLFVSEAFPLSTFFTHSSARVFLTARPEDGVTTVDAHWGFS